MSKTGILLMVVALSFVIDACKSIQKANMYSVADDVKLGRQVAGQIDADGQNYPILPEAGNERVYGFIREIRDKAAVDLELMQRQSLDIRHGRVTRTEVVQRELHTNPLKLAHFLDGGLKVTMEEALRQLEFEKARINALLFDQDQYVADKLFPLQLSRAHIH